MTQKQVYTHDSRAICGTTHITILTAVRIAKQYSHRLPTVAELMDAYGMSRATAYRWRSALKAAA